jgi:hypothetical protein
MLSPSHAIEVQLRVDNGNRFCYSRPNSWWQATAEA